MEDKASKMTPGLPVRLNHAMHCWCTSSATLVRSNPGTYYMDTPQKSLWIVPGFTVKRFLFTDVPELTDPDMWVYTSRFTPERSSVNIRVHHSRRGAAKYLILGSFRAFAVWLGNCTNG